MADKKYRDLTLHRMSREEYNKENGERAMEESYGEDAVIVYWVESDTEEGARAGIKRTDGRYCVYGLNRDEEGISFADMLEVLFFDFTAYDEED